MECPATIEDLQDIVRRQTTVRVSGGGSKSALAAGANVSLRRLAGVREYEPSEFTFTAMAGTSVGAIEGMLAEHGQYLPFDPPLVETGATLGGMVAAGLSGPGRFRYGGVRDFLLGVRLVNGEGELIRGGGKVVKNAAGFDLPKLMVGSQGRFGIIVELSCKVFPRPAAWATLVVEHADLGAAIETMECLAGSSLELTCLELEPPGRLRLRLAGMPESLPRRIERVRAVAGGRATEITGPDETVVWRDAREFAWVPPDWGLVKIPLTPGRIIAMEKTLDGLSATTARRYSVAGNVLWLAWPSQWPSDLLDRLLVGQGLSGVAILGDWPDPFLGRSLENPFAGRLLRVYDPQHKFQRPMSTSSV